MYRVLDLHTRTWSRRVYQTRATATRAAERQNLKYGAHRYASRRMS